jgi:hypothetical protein
MAQKFAKNSAGSLKFICGRHGTVMMKTRIGYLCVLKPDMQSGAVLHETGQHFRLLLEEAREIKPKIHVSKEEANTD